MLLAERHCSCEIKALHYKEELKLFNFHPQKDSEEENSNRLPK
jgi:hypothetical protein